MNLFSHRSSTVVEATELRLKIYGSVQSERGVRHGLKSRTQSVEIQVKSRNPSAEIRNPTRNTEIHCEIQKSN